MIPYALQMQGVRDYPPSRISFGEATEHVLITGPNGVGKSTLTFCIGATLCSSKVDIEGLRSSNLPAGKPWYANITFIFKNEGPSRIDAPHFVAFRIIVEQATKRDALQKEYQILGGDDEQNMKLTARYTSGNANGRNFSAYKKDLQRTYKIDSDLFYLIWYQQEVNQFAAMSPEERFRRFSDILNISDIQKKWETELEHLKDIEQKIEHLTATVHMTKHHLNIAETALNNYLQNKQRLEQAGTQHIMYVIALEKKYTEETQQTKQLLHDMQQQRQQALIKKQQLQHDSAIYEQQLTTWQETSNHYTFTLETIANTISEKKIDLDSMYEALQTLEQQLEATQEKRQQLRYDEKTTIEKFEQTTTALETTTIQKQQLQQQQIHLKQQQIDTITKLTTIQQLYATLQEKYNDAQKLLAQYSNSSYVQQHIEQLEQAQLDFFAKKAPIEQTITTLTNTMEQLQQNKVLSKRQQQGLADLQKHNIKAYTLRDLIELIPTAPLALEQQIDTIKYTIFYDAKHYAPINDLYYVSLKQIIPDRSINAIHELGLRIRTDLHEQQQNFANKALWWIQQLFTANPRIQQHGLVDERGIRGAQEPPSFILSNAALQNTLQNYKQQLQQQHVALQQLHEQYEQDKQSFHQWQGILRKIQEAEGIILSASELPLLARQINALQQRIDALTNHQNNIENTLQDVRDEEAYSRFEKNKLHEELIIYKQLGALADKQLELQQLQQQIKVAQHELTALTNTHTKQQQEIEQVGRQIRTLSEQIENDKSTIRNLNSEITSYNLTISRTEEQQQQHEANIIKWQLRLFELQNIVPHLVAAILEENVPTDWSETKLLHANTQAQATFENARNTKVNTHAEQNYNAMKQDYKQKKAELAHVENLLEIHARRTAEAEENLETTINMYVTKMNELFQKYMTIFQFEGQIDQERIIEKSGRIKYLLYMKVRKIGYQDFLEDVSYKARNGKVGKGVSGGEESLSSLLFALSLLQNLAISPSYIVLDEFDSTLDESRKETVLNLYATELKRKLIVLSPKTHSKAYYNHFSHVFIVEHNPTIPQSRVVGIHSKLPLYEGCSPS